MYNGCGSGVLALCVELIRMIKTDAPWEMASKSGFEICN
jgi:hypothetical protein